MWVASIKTELLEQLTWKDLNVCWVNVKSLYDKCGFADIARPLKLYIEEHD